MALRCTRGHLKPRILAVVLALGFATVILSYAAVRIRSYDLSLADAGGIERALCYYLADHRALPSTLATLVDSGYCIVQKDGSWKVPFLGGKCSHDAFGVPYVIEKPKWVEYTQPTDLGIVTEQGTLLSDNNPIIRASQRAEYPGYDANMRGVSARIAKEMESIGLLRHVQDNHDK